MLVLTRKEREKIVLPDSGVTIEVVDIRQGKVKLGITAPKGYAVHRSEVWARIQTERGKSTPPRAS
jgi:carbon storage regulator